MSFTDTLRHDHEAIFKALDECQKLGISSEEGKKKLVQARTLVQAHLKREDTQLYPVMQRHEETRELGATYSAEMQNITADVNGFFDAYASGGSGLDYARHLGRTVSQLRQRMTREEVRLYPAFANYCEK
ncbi:hemerythrin domain-containing protein [Paraburkholderia sartisoli]|uniref:Hemerythrin HHE cation binding domain-containing protein n=1 Tax=Paraburkholderia sartisoli TaxID=83784 RepID=A0A1H4F3Q0_9BURK|nr:hemerythrin domain-containing protein [Paraburkholderia sartisoli]SEA91955.1 Hemerythrin HHE cation binding domain-containing protein [Paraburkholderia sartisoli]